MTSISRNVVAGPVAGAWLQWLPVVLGLAALYVATYMDLARGPWNDEQNAHGPFVIAIIAWLVWNHRRALAALPERGNPVAGALLLAFGLALYCIGRIAEFIYFDAFSQIPVLAGLLMITRGTCAVRLLWFPLFFLIFLVPLPGVLIDVATGPLKHAVSVLAENALYFAGYPIARNGVVLTIGQYQLLVADACSGLNSIYSLSALGMFFLYVVRDDRWGKTALLLLSIWPIAFVANIVRVIVLVLVTYHLGDDAGQGLLHNFSGILLFMSSLLSLFVLHAILDRVLPPGARGVSR